MNEWIKFLLLCHTYNYAQGTKSCKQDPSRCVYIFMQFYKKKIEQF